MRFFGWRRVRVIDELRLTEVAYHPASGQCAVAGLVERWHWEWRRVR